MAKKNNITSIVKYKQKVHLNIGMAIFGIIFVYLIITVFMYVLTDRTTSYEVRIGSILKDSEYTGMAVREEKVVKAPQSGFINYYTNTNIKAKVGSKIGIFTSTEILDKDRKNKTQTKKELTADQQNTVGILVQSFSEGFHPESFSDVYSLKDTIHNTISDVSTINKAQVLDQYIVGGNTSSLIQAIDDGIVVYNIDGYETITAEDVTPKMLHKTDYHLKHFSNNMKVKVGDPIYKVVTSENWKLVVPISKETASQLKEKTSVRVRFKKDGQTLRAGLELGKKGKQNIAYLSFSSSMIRYVDDRFLDIEIIIEDKTGLKIPKSAVKSKEFYTIPEEYLTQGGNSKERSVIRKGKKSVEFVPASVFFVSDNIAYLSMDHFKDGDTILKPDSNMIYTLNEKDSLHGVYNINKGYAVFEQVTVLCESDDYYIVESGNSYSISNYDHIALDASKVKDNDIIIQ